MKKLTLSLLALSVSVSAHAGGSQVGNAGKARIDMLNVLKERPCRDFPLCNDIQGSTLHGHLTVSSDLRKKILEQHHDRKTDSNVVDFVGSEKYVGLLRSKVDDQVLSIIDRTTLNLLREIKMPKKLAAILKGGEIERLYFLDEGNILLLDTLKKAGLSGSQLIAVDLNSLDVEVAQDYRVSAIIENNVYAEFANGRQGASPDVRIFDTKLKKIQDVKLDYFVRLWPEADVAQGNQTVVLSTGQVLLRKDSRAFLGSEDGKSLFLTVDHPSGNKGQIYDVTLDNIATEVDALNIVIENKDLSFNETACRFEGDAQQSARANKILRSAAENTLTNFQLKDFGILLKSRFLSTFPNVSSYMRLVASLDSRTESPFGGVVDSSYLDYDVLAEDISCLQKLTMDREVSSIDVLGEDMTTPALRVAMPVVRALGANLQNRYQKALWGNAGLYKDDQNLKVAVAFQSEILNGTNSKLKIYLSERETDPSFILLNQNIDVESVAGITKIDLPEISDAQQESWWKHWSKKYAGKNIFTQTMKIYDVSGKTIMVSIHYMGNGEVRVQAQFK